ncbi:hypothetical protein HMPREF9607_01619 [Cutibacterium modestum HL044PA1]|uniref:Uncharacterized protein n=1 Tax=Cutibacterium modestum HL044PA1 TaxID=765109 RepID=A0ABP2K865_9ACTN|nr:hypothetical protein HMPREF9607_01619 [Cutibacterium modestum HL044PA1]
MASTGGAINSLTSLLAPLGDLRIAGIYEVLLFAGQGMHCL